MKKEKWSGVKADLEHEKKVRQERAINIKAEILMFTLFLMFCAMLIAFILEVTR